MTNKSMGADAAQMDLIEWECIAARRAAWATMESLGALWVNSCTAAWATENKATQLLAAREAGFAVPETLISNDPAAIREFCALHQQAGVVHKMFHPAQFGSKVACAALVTPAILANEELLGTLPGIYQARHRLECDVRVLVAGRAVLAARLKNEASEHIDSRIMTHRPGCVHPFVLDGVLRQHCLALMERLGIVTGSIDLGLGLDGSPVFFEVNQAGNFLWMEQCNSDIPVLDMFARFIQSGDPDYEYGKCGLNRLAFTSFAN